MKAGDGSSYARTLDCVHCGLCLPACPTYDVLGLETDSPRGRIYLMRALAEGTVTDVAAVRPHLDQCLGCRACETVCPSGVRYGELLETVRAELELSQPSRSWGRRWRRWLLTKVLAHQGRLRAVFWWLRLAAVLRLDVVAARLRLLPRGMAWLRPRIPPGGERRPIRGVFAAHGRERARVALFTGCVMETMFGAVNRATLALLRSNGFAVDAPAAQACCGALLLHDGLRDQARALAQRNIAAFADASIVVVNSAGCGAALKDYGHLLGTPAARQFAAKVRDVCEWLGAEGLTVAPARFPHRVAYDDPCHLCHGQGVRAEPRALLSQVPGLTLVKHRDPEGCCGSAGIYNLLQPELAAEIGKRKADALVASGAEVVVTGNPGCMMQIQGHLRQQGATLRVLHPVELLLPPGPRPEG